MIDVRKEYAYFDYAATTFMPPEVMESWLEYNQKIGISSGRGKNAINVMADEIAVQARKDIHHFFSEDKRYQLIIYRSLTNAINEIAYSLEHYIEPMDIILLGPYEHHSNLLPWRELAKRKGAITFEMPVLPDGTIDCNSLLALKDRIKVISFSSVANTNGFRINISDIKGILSKDTLVIVDDSQKCAHEQIENAKEIDIHLVNPHKMYGPKNLAGALVSEKVVDIMRPSIYGGGMVERVGFPNTWKEGVAAFEGGTQDVAGIYAWRAACNYISKIGFKQIHENESKIYERIEKELKDVGKVKILSVPKTTSLLSFQHEQIHAHDIEDLFSEKKVLIRAGHICSQNSIAKYGYKPIVRISFGIGIQENDVERLVDVIRGTLG